MDEEIEDLYYKQSSSRPRLDFVSKILREEVERHSRVYVIIDTLDECEAAYRLRLLTELKIMQPTLKLMVTSRFFDAFGADMGVDTDIEILASDEDIKTYVQLTAQATPRLMRWISADRSLLEVIETKVIEAAQRV